MTKTNVRTLQKRLKACGFILTADGNYGPHTHRIVGRFREGFVGKRKRNGDWMRPIPQGGPVRFGDRTWRAIRWSAKHDGRVSPNFRWREFACRDPRFPDIRVNRALVVALEKLRRITGKSISVVSGYRTERWNRHVGGASNSQHLYGCAADIGEGQRITITQAVEAGFTGIGYDDDNWFVEHADVRHAGPNNTTGASVGDPTLWKYS